MSVEAPSRTGRYQFMPSLTPEEEAWLEEDIRERGVLIPIEVDEDGNILDGYNRKRLASKLGVDCPTVVRRGLSETQKRLHAASLNLRRRHLTEAQKAMLGRQLEPDIRAEAAERQKTLGRTHGAPPGGQLATSRDAHGKSRDIVAEFVGLGSGRTYDRYRAMLDEIEQKAPQLIGPLSMGDMTLREASRAVNPRPPRQRPKTDDDVGAEDADTEEAEAKAEALHAASVIERQTIMWGTVPIYYRVQSSDIRRRVVDGQEREYRRERRTKREVVEWSADIDHENMTREEAAYALGTAIGNAVVRHFMAHGFTD